MFRRAQSIIGMGANRLTHNVFSTNKMLTREMALFTKIYKPMPGKRSAEPPPPPPVVRNGNIQFPSMRVVYSNSETGAPEWKIMNRSEALTFAKSMNLDLVVVNAKADPPVCKVEDYAQRLVVAKTREKEVKATQKARALKEIFMTGGIEKRDFLTKMKKVNEFLTRGHPVKVTVVPKRFLKNDRFKNGVRRDRMAGFDETILMLLENLEGLSIIMTEQKVKAPPPPTHTRTGQKIVIKKVETKPAKRGGGTDSSSSSAGTSERGELIDGEDLGGDDSEDDEEELAPTGPGGSRPVLRREFMLTPKADMIEKPAKKTKEPTVQKEA